MSPGRKVLEACLAQVGEGRTLLLHRGNLPKLRGRRAFLSAFLVLELKGF